MEDSRQVFKNGSQQKPNDLKNNISGLRDLILIVSPAFICVSFIFNFFYFYALKIPFEKVPLSTTDYIITANAIIPSVFSISIALILHQIFTYFTIKDVYLELKNDKSISKDFKDIISTLDIIVLIVIIAMTISIFNKTSLLEINRPMVFGIMLSYLFIIDIYFKMDKNRSRIIIISITTLTISLTSAVDLANSNYNSLLSTLSISGNTYHVMRSFSSGFLLRDRAKNELIFLTTTGVRINFQQPYNIQKELKNNKEYISLLNSLEELKNIKEDSSLRNRTQELINIVEYLKNINEYSSLRKRIPPER